MTRESRGASGSSVRTGVMMKTVKDSRPLAFRSLNNTFISPLKAAAEVLSSRLTPIKLSDSPKIPKRLNLSQI